MKVRCFFDAIALVGILKPYHIQPNNAVCMRITTIHSQKIEISINYIKLYVPISYSYHPNATQFVILPISILGTLTMTYDSTLYLSMPRTQKAEYII